MTGCRTPNKAPAMRIELDSHLLRHCHEYHRRAGIPDADIIVRRSDDGQLEVLMRYEDEFGKEFFSGAAIDTTNTKADIDRLIYMAVMACTETVLAKSATIH